MNKKEMSATITMPINKDEILTKMTVHEFVDTKIIDKIVNSDVLKKQKWTQNEINLMNNTLLKLKKQVNKEGYNKLTFESKPFGRVYTKNKITLGTLYRRIRHTLCKDYYVDVDIVNCQPSILHSVLSCNGFQCQKLGTYINNREEVFEQIMSSYSCSREIAKELINALVNGGSVDSWIKENNLTQGFYLPYIDLLSTEITNAQTAIIQNNKHHIEKLKEYKLKHDKEYKGDYTFMSYFLGQYEKLIIEVVVNYLKEKERIDDRNIFVYCQDGIMLLKSAYHREDFELIENELRDKVGLNIQFKIKEMDEAFTKDELAQEDKDERIIYVNSDNNCAELLFEELKNTLFFCKNQLFFKNEHIWTNNKTLIDLTLLNFILKKQYYTINEKGNAKPYSQFVNHAENIRKALYSKIMTENNRDENYEKFHSTTKGRICFLDGVLDFIEKRFYTWDEIHFEYYSTVQIKRNYQEYFENPNKEDINNVKEKIYDIAFGNKVNDALHFLSRGIAGHCEDKNFSVYIGNRDCGKGVIYDSLTCAFENYVKSWDLSNIQYQRETHQQETSRDLYWLIDLQFVRLAISQEIPAVEKNMKTCSKKFKKMTGGGDEHIARRNFDRVDTHFKIDTTFLMMGNNEMLADKQDLFEHCVEFHSVIQFKSQKQIDAMIEDKEDEQILQIYKVGDPNIKERCKTDEWKNAMIYLLYEHYQDKPVSTFKKIEDSDDTEKSLRKRILENFIITGKKEDYMTCEQVHSILLDSKQKVKIELESLNVFKKQQTSGEDRKKQCFFGLKRKVDVEV